MTDETKANNVTVSVNSLFAQLSQLEKATEMSQEHFPILIDASSTN